MAFWGSRARGPPRAGRAAERAGARTRAGVAGMRRWKRKRLLRREQETVLEQCGCALGAGARPGNGSAGAVPPAPSAATACAQLFASEQAKEPAEQPARSRSSRPASCPTPSVSKQTILSPSSRPASRPPCSRSSAVVPAAASQPAGPLWEQLVRRRALSSSNPLEIGFGPLFVGPL